MKTYVIGLIFLGLTSLMHSQNEITKVNENTVNSKSDITVKNLDYLASFDAENLSESINLFHKKVANFDIKSLSIYTPNEPSNYTVVFKERNNEIITIYNQAGTIISSNEKFEGNKLPYSISSKVSKSHPGWEINKVKCFITYSGNRNSETYYKIVLKKDNKKQTIKIEA